jgi:D-arabinose 1-dehydrogenase-like Zn-dependent alcohol dehydrogenase
MHMEKKIIMEKGQRLVIVGMGGVGGPAAMLSRKLLPGVDITVIREESRFIVR